jgi:hydroxymethylbilane synthase
MRWLAAIHDAESAACVAAERALLAVLDGSCRTPIGALAIISPAKRLCLRGLLARPDGSAVLTAEREGRPDEAVRLGRDAGADLRGRAGPGFLDGRD